ncbi:hypothetical protein MRB53_002627 [Persea americana]|uniref:Uncharacterized protein n=1 Tax=Persea americana TaxID=3435 RepID=A0ACC2MWM8_PERAE|nr:hypothetical protein MRB53_002627 [Persea americana]|eukprot:TRINITY_DN1939_c0_g1_i1.p1 TRINITY_DN1939_c0_g1~~TRINITY_DN1939_c0_g1_i1.p1  ORF type:complete len:284 (-),score=54.16 TRINITY_DN1939_c0_g1_i1:436-1287(-)
MRRQGQYADSGVSRMMAAQLQQLSAQRMQHNSAMNHYSGQPDTLPIDEERKYIASKVEGQWQWDRDGPKGPNSLSSQLYKEGQGSDPSRSLFQGQRPDPKLGLDKQANKDTRAQDHEQDMEIGYEEHTIPPTFESLEQKFIDDIMKLTKEQQEAEDAENARHRERIDEINAQYQEKLMAMRASQAAHRDEFLRRESQARQHQYQQAGLNHYQNSAGPSDPHGYGAPATAASDALGEAHRAYAAGHYESHRERAQYMGGNQDHGFESRGNYTGGRSYGSGRRYY